MAQNLIKTAYLTLFLSLFFNLNSFAQKEDGLKLWYDKPAELWVEALPVGNGRLGAMVYGKPDEEIIQLNENTLWAGQPYRNDNPQAKEVLPKVRELIFDKKYKEAQDLINQKFFSGLNGMPYQTFGKLRLNFNNGGEVTNYHRELDLEKAVATTRYTKNGVDYNMEVFASFPAQVLMIKITAGKPGALHFSAALDREKFEKTAVLDDKTLQLTGISGDHEGIKGAVKFEARAKIIPQGGTMTATAKGIEVSNADAAVIYISMATSFKNYNDITGNAKKKVADALDEVSGKSYNELLQEHVDDYQRYFNKVNFRLGNKKTSKKPTDVRIAEFKEGNDLDLVSLYFQFGRYLLISSSRPGTQPANLQGIWAHELIPAWDSKYTININTEMNYWPSEITNLTELNEPLMQMVRDLSETGKKTARDMYGAGGWMAHHNTDIWRITGPVDGAFWGMWPMGGTWLSQHLFDKYDFSGDKAFLKSVFPVVKGASEFIMDVLVKEPEHGWLVVAPSVSPENAPAIHGDASISAGTTMDNQLVFDLLSKTLRAAVILDDDKAFIKKLQTTLKQLPPMQIGHWGQLQEWMTDWDNPEDHHRHVSHLYGLYPSNQISPYYSPLLFQAAKTSLLARGDESTGWSMGWKVNLWARLLDGNHAYKLIKDQLSPSILPDGKQKGGTYPNLFDAHPPFQIDGNFGCTAGIAEMLLQSQDGAVHILPALPDAWTEGKITGLRARGGFEIDIQWSQNKPEEVKIHSNLGGNLRIRSYTKLSAEGLTKEKGTNDNEFYQLRDIKDPLVSEEASLEKPQLKPVFEYDLQTTKGGDYVLYSAE